MQTNTDSGAGNDGNAEAFMITASRLMELPNRSPGQISEMGADDHFEWVPFAVFDCETEAEGEKSANPNFDADLLEDLPL